MQEFQDLLDDMQATDKTGMIRESASGLRRTDGILGEDGRYPDTR